MSVIRGVEGGCAGKFGCLIQPKDTKRNKKYKF